MLSPMSKEVSFRQSVIQGERRFLGRTVVRGRDLWVGRDFLDGNFSLLGVSLAIEIELLTNDL